MFNVGEKIRITNRDKDERWWAEVIDVGRVVSLNTTIISGATMRLPPDEDMKRVRDYYPDYPGPESNGQVMRILWGHVLTCYVAPDGRIVADEIVGFRLPEKN